MADDKQRESSGALVIPGDGEPQGSDAALAVLAEQEEEAEIIPSGAPVPARPVDPDAPRRGRPKNKRMTAGRLELRQAKPAAAPTPAVAPEGIPDGPAEWDDRKKSRAQKVIGRLARFGFSLVASARQQPVWRLNEDEERDIAESGVDALLALRELSPKWAATIDGIVDKAEPAVFVAVVYGVAEEKYLAEKQLKAGHPVLVGK